MADGYLITVGRIDMPDEVWTGFSELAAGLGHKRYSRLLAAGS